MCAYTAAKPWEANASSHSAISSQPLLLMVKQAIERDTLAIVIHIFKHMLEVGGIQLPNLRRLMLAHAVLSLFTAIVIIMAKKFIYQWK